MGESNENRRRPVAQGLRKGLSAYIWLLKILIPVSLATALLDYGGWIQKLDFVLQPVMATLSLPPAAALPILIGMTAGVYGCLAAMAVLPLSVDQVTLVSVFVLIAHNLPQEGIIQSRSGIGFVKATLVRIAAAIAACGVVAWCLQVDGAAAAAAAAGIGSSAPLWVFLQDWLAGMLRLCAKVFVIVMGVMVLIEAMKAFNLVDLFVRVFAPVLKMMGLHERAGMLWLTSVLFGLAYAGAVIVEESGDLQLSPEEVEKLHLSIGINHSMVEDPLLFLPFGVNLFWLLVPRLAAAVAAVYLISLWFRFKRAAGRKTAIR